MAAASFPLEEFDEKFLTCAVCDEIYTDPRVLPCLHTFCTKCLVKWRKGKSHFTCPTCRQQVRLQEGGISSLPQYFFMNSLLDFRALHNSEEAHAQCQMCKSDNKVDGRCADCRLLLCKNCITAHRNIPALKDHYIITLDDLKNPGSRPKYTRAPYCPRHTDQRMAFYCQPCAKLVCRDCTITEHRPGPNHDPQEVSKVAQKYKAGLQKLVEKTKHTDDVLKKTKQTVGHELTSITTNCQRVRKEIKEHFADMRKKLDEEEKKVTERLDKMEKDQKEPLLREEKELEQNIASTEEGLTFSTDILDRGNDVEILTHRQQLEDRLNALSSTQIQHKALTNNVYFKPDTTCTNLVECFLILTDEPLFITEAPVESLPTTCTVIFRPRKGQVWETNPQVTVTSPVGQCVKLDITKASGGEFRAVWRPQISGKHVVCVTAGRRVGHNSLCSSLTVDVRSNNPVLRFGLNGTQQGQFNTPIDLSVRRRSLYVADTYNKRVQVFDLRGNFCYSFSTTANPASIAVHIDSTIVSQCAGQVKRFSPSGELLHQFSLSQHCTDPYGLAVQRNGRIVVADKGKHSIFLFGADGTLVKQVGGQGQGNWQFNEPCFVCVDKEDNIIVADKENHRIQVFDENLNFQYKFGQQGRQPQDMFGPIGVSADSRGNIVLANIGGTTDGIEHSKELQVFRPDGTWVSTISSDRDKLNLPHGVAVTEDGHVFVADPGDHCIRKYRYM
ncbi:PREDICTED: E3 ubiquitin-protein ligase TRIM71-like [Branchiostoma belcheri]|uniref:RING-type E3 ubiquitin transferase n=1 Tax=Branchiostoma belcheri TaxID=7741 RepID=A0A6P4YPM5_BRABE|nr:PREDICTED: E3 ubiquitin-protein ligase TRIM71-like [Branchiostoma belcheri]